MENIENKLEEILTWLKKYKEHTGCKGVVLGVSGGKDSTIVAMLAKKVWGENALGILMPNKVQADLSDSLAIVKALQMRHLVVNIGEAYQGLLSAIEGEGTEVSVKAKSNMPPRLRMTALYAVAQTLGYQVIGTGNASEGYIGWCTKFGDCAHDFNPIAHLTCSQVVEMGRLLAKEYGLEEKFIVKKPADGLTGKSDEENFGFSYSALDSYISGGEIDEEIKAKIDSMHAFSAHKRRMPANILNTPL